MKFRTKKLAGFTLGQVSLHNRVGSDETKKAIKAERYFKLSLSKYQASRCKHIMRAQEKEQKQAKRCWVQ
jgi:hypothetical protein